MMTTDTGLPGEAAEPIEPAQPAETQPTAETVPAPVPTFGQALATLDNAAFGAAAFDSATFDSAAFDSAAIEAETQRRAQEAARRAGRRRNAVRWLAAVTVTLAVGGGTAFALTMPQCTDMPGLGTAPDGRYGFPALTLPTLPAGQPAPSASANSDAEQHLADIRKLLLPHPGGAANQAVKSAANGWLTDPSSLFVVQDGKVTFAEFGLRHTAVTSWKTTDGATTSIYLLQFADAKAASTAQSKLSDDDMTVDDTASLSAALTGVPQDAKSYQITPYASISGDYTPVKDGGTLTRYGSFGSGDVIAIVIQSGPAGLPFAPFQQVMTLQAEMLQ